MKDQNSLGRTESRGRYVVRAITQVIDECGIARTACGETIYEQEDLPRRTGLIDTAGREIWNMPTARRIGFDLDK